MTVREKIKDRMDDLESLMVSNIHLENPELVLELVQSIAKFYSILGDEDRDYINSVRYAVEHKLSWNN